MIINTKRVDKYDPWFGIINDLKNGDFSFFYYLNKPFYSIEKLLYNFVNFSLKILLNNA